MTQAAMDSTMVAVTLKPCPFCGGTPRKIVREGRLPFVECRACNIEMSGWTEDAAIAAWNTRHQSGRTGAGEDAS